MNRSGVHQTAIVDVGAEIGRGTVVWHYTHVMAGAVIGVRCSLGQNVHVAGGVRIGDGCRIQNNVSIFRGVELGDDVFVGPSVVFTNVLKPRAFIKTSPESYEPTRVRRGASIGANATIVCGVTIGEYAVVGAGSVVTRGVDPYALVFGVPARWSAWVCACGEELRPERWTPVDGSDERRGCCDSCTKLYAFTSAHPHMRRFIDDPNAPWVCPGCCTRFDECPDLNAHNCPKCGGKVCPARLWNRVLSCLPKSPCGAADFLRASGDCLCVKCELPYYQHPCCANSEDAIAATTYPVYTLHVLCDGTHVHL